ncbi:MAG: dephospho-CoA kinase [Verrucomicrobiota bacterium]|jgi:dephospho-CoA kinase
MKVFGLTGGIGMGKSTAARLLGERGLPVVDTDQLARDIVEPGQPALQEIQNVFGSHVIGADGHLRRGELAKIVFSDVAAREKLENITHPRILALWKKQVARWREEKRPAAVVVIPLLFETKAETEFDAVICVACSAQTEGKRLAERNWTPEQIQQRLAAQWPVETKISRSHFVIWSEGNPEIMAEQLARIV